MTFPTRRDCRYQAAILQDDKVLLLKVRDPFSGETFWLVPGGGREGSESEEDCVRREAQEETTLVVHVERLLWEEAITNDSTYRRTRTYLCRVLAGQAAAGSEPELEQHEHHIIEDLAWFPLNQPELWGQEIDDDAITLQFLKQLRETLLA